MPKDSSALGRAKYINIWLQYQYQVRIYKQYNKCNSNQNETYTDVKRSKHFDFNAENKDKNPKFKLADHMRISRYKNILKEGYTISWSEDILSLKC